MKGKEMEAFISCFNEFSSVPIALTSLTKEEEELYNQEKIFIPLMEEAIQDKGFDPNTCEEIPKQLRSFKQPITTSCPGLELQIHFQGIKSYSLAFLWDTSANLNIFRYNYFLANQWIEATTKITFGNGKHDYVSYVKLQLNSQMDTLMKLFLFIMR